MCRYDHTVEAFGDEFIVFGGKYESGCFNDVHKFNTKTLEWSTPNVVGIFPAGRCAALIVSVLCC